MATTHLVLALTAAFGLTVFATPPQQTPANPSRDNAPAAGKGIIRGRVTDRETGQPLARVLVMLVSEAWREQAMSSAATMGQSGIINDGGPTQNQPRNALTSADGRFEFKQVPAGAYSVSFSVSMTRGTHLDQRFGDTTPRDPLNPGRRLPPIVIREGEIRENVNAALWRALAVEGRVVDDAGEPVANVEITSSRWDGPPTMSAGLPRTTDDRGMFRLFGLSAGQYRICADMRFQFAPVEDVQEKWIRTCYPSAVSDSAAQPVVVSTTEAGPIEIRLQRNRTYTISGTVIDSSGAPIARPSVNLVTITPTGSGSSSSSVQVKPGGHFVASGVTPGDYGIQAYTGRWRFSSSDDTGEREMGYVPVRIDAADVDGLVVATSKATKVAGRIVFDAEVPDDARKLTIRTMPDMNSAQRRMMFEPQAPAEVRDDMSFELDGLFGPQMLMVAGAPRGWIVKSVIYRGADVTDTAIEFKSSTDPRLLEITLTKQGAFVTGRVLSNDGTEPTDVSVVLLPADVSRWRPTPGLPAIPLKADGTFTIGPVRAGEYIAAAVTGMSLAKLFEPSARADIAARIARAGTHLTLVENQKHAIELRLTKLE